VTLPTGSGFGDGTNPSLSLIRSVAALLINGGPHWTPLTVDGTGLGFVVGDNELLRRELEAESEDFDLVLEAVVDGFDDDRVKLFEEVTELVELDFRVELEDETAFAEDSPGMHLNPLTESPVSVSFGSLHPTQYSSRQLCRSSEETYPAGQSQHL
jgi:hypothetical protein